MLILHDAVYDTKTLSENPTRSPETFELPTRKIYQTVTAYFTPREALTHVPQTNNSIKYITEIKRKEFKYNIVERHQYTKKESKRIDEQKPQKLIRK